MDEELLAAISEILDKKLDEKLDQKLDPIRQDITGLDQKVSGLQKQVDFVAVHVKNILDENVKFNDALFQVQSHEARMRALEDKVRP